MRLSERREVICLKFAKSCLRLKNFEKLFPMHSSGHGMKTRHEAKYQVSQSNSKRHANSAIPQMLKSLNKEHKEQKQQLKKIKNSFMSPTNFACTRIYCWDNKPIIIIIIIMFTETAAYHICTDLKWRGLKGWIDKRSHFHLIYLELYFWCLFLQLSLGKIKFRPKLPWPSWAEGSPGAVDRI